ncbi:hypothetical protein KPATCC21470_7206 [Kitasatospora purpeofusca]
MGAVGVAGAGVCVRGGVGDGSWVAGVRGGAAVGSPGDGVASLAAASWRGICWAPRSTAARPGGGASASLADPRAAGGCR